MDERKPARRPQGVQAPGAVAHRANRVWAPFEKGNQAAKRHGAYSATARQPRALALVEWVLAQDTLVHVHDESFRPALWRWAERQAMADLLMAALAEHHAEREGVPCPGCEQCRGWEERWQKFDRTAERAGAAIGLDPSSRAQLLDRMNASGLFDMAEEATSMLGSLFDGLQTYWALREYALDLAERLASAGEVVPEPPPEVLALEAAARPDEEPA